MRAQRPTGAAPCIDASAEALPFPDQSFDSAMAVLSDHHWGDPIAGLLEMRRVARQVVVLQWDNAETQRFWLIRDYLPGPTHSPLDGRAWPSVPRRSEHAWSGC